MLILLTCIFFTRSVSTSTLTSWKEGGKKHQIEKANRVLHGCSARAAPPAAAPRRRRARCSRPRPEGVWGRAV